MYNKIFYKKFSSDVKFIRCFYLYTDQFRQKQKQIFQNLIETKLEFF